MSIYTSSTFAAPVMYAILFLIVRREALDRKRLRPHNAFLVVTYWCRRSGKRQERSASSPAALRASTPNSSHENPPSTSTTAHSSKDKQ
ncbi:hypothetical protein CC80DRAFT_549745 [Byssothecium circinans]|uniref:Uncharacterized protein n=1 Tax=Byssothecium circinans TaxID=147558 RepID=A0A6A5U1F3_9PLEO|nr:hypothetical protein CC80DRAFT_549745 [Byssothecium circinans]